MPFGIAFYRKDANILLLTAGSCALLKLFVLELHIM
jgi:hypothetical protein